ncbi:hypothetical protein L484_018071 [Morus notabilis]|uniref:Uncharacterized protein n=1 Tax=Morus notabilis TaxID=981085 RepID=W9QV72_9ROSA|nr:hypothetical protein L484_018071 [Morus notabilis]
MHATSVMKLGSWIHEADNAPAFSASLAYTCPIGRSIIHMCGDSGVVMIFPENFFLMKESIDLGGVEISARLRWHEMASENAGCNFRSKKKDEDYSMRVVVGALWLWLLGICASVDLFRESSGTNLLCNKIPTMSCVNRMQEYFEL